jgi:hypothetical protein
MKWEDDVKQDLKVMKIYNGKSKLIVGQKISGSLSKPRLENTCSTDRISSSFLSRKFTKV